MSMTPINLEEILVVNIAGALMLLVLPFLRMQTRESKHVDDHLFNWMVALALGALCEAAVGEAESRVSYERRHNANA